MNDYHNSIARQFNDIAPDVDFWTLRLTSETQEAVSVRQGVMQPVYNHHAFGAMLTVVSGDGCGYAATSDLTPSGLKNAARLACDWAKQSSSLGLLKAHDYPRPEAKAHYETPVKQPWHDMPLDEKITLLQDANTALKISDSIVGLEHIVVLIPLISCPPCNRPGKIEAVGLCKVIIGFEFSTIDASAAAVQAYNTYVPRRTSLQFHIVTACLKTQNDIF